MGSALLKALRERPQRFTTHVQTRITAEDAARMDALINRLVKDGFTDTTRGTFVRAAILTALESEGA